jgi:hypothetical protein
LSAPIIAALLILLGGLATAARGVHAATPAAVVEDVSADVRDIALFDFIEAGRTIELGGQGRLVLGYLSACLREEIIGGTVIIGTIRSTVEGGRVNRQTVECDGGSLQLTSAQAGKSGVQVVRAGEASGTAGETKPKLTLYGASPIILAPAAAGKAIFKRLDRDAAEIEIAFDNGVADMAKAGRKLARGGIYRVSVGGQSTVFRIDRYARPGLEPLLSRLVRF